MRQGIVGLISLLSVGLSAGACSKNESAKAQPSATASSAEAAKTAGPSKAAAVGEPAPDFTLTGLDGQKVSLSDHKGKIVVLEWFNPDCPFVKEAHGNGSLKGMAARYRDKDVVWLAINSGAPGKQGHGSDTNSAGKERYGIDYPILFDEDGAVGRRYGATNTPHMYVVDKQGNLAYRGALDSTRGDYEDAEGANYFVADALTDLIAGKEVRSADTKAWGCSVKYARR